MAFHVVFLESWCDVRKIGTDHHDNHTYGLATFLSMAWDRQQTKTIHVYGPPSTEDLVKAAVHYYEISAEIRIADEGRTAHLEPMQRKHGSVLSNAQSHLISAAIASGMFPGE